MKGMSPSGKLRTTYTEVSARNCFSERYITIQEPCAQGEQVARLRRFLSRISRTPESAVTNGPRMVRTSGQK